LPDSLLPQSCHTMTTTTEGWQPGGGCLLRATNVQRAVSAEDMAESRCSCGCQPWQHYLAAPLSQGSAAMLLVTSRLVVGVYRQSHRSSIVDPLNVPGRTNLVRILCVVNAECDTRSAIVVSFRAQHDANAMDPTTNQNVNDSTAAPRTPPLCCCTGPHHTTHYPAGPRLAS
jgi:hypothetical protein